MKKMLLTVTGISACASLFAADANSPSALTDAIAKLKAEPNYSWTIKVELPTLQGFDLAPMQGKTEKDGFMLVTQDFNGTTAQAVLSGTNAVLKLEDAWQTADSVDQTGFNGWWLAYTKSGADEALDLVNKAKELKLDANGVWSGDFTEAGATELLGPPRPPGSTNAPPAAKNAKGTVKFWIKDGELSKFESHVQGLVAFAPDQDPQDFETTRTGEIHDQGKTKVEVPAEAKTKLSAK